MAAKNKYQFPDTYALVLCGGQSTRMGTDKSMLQYYDKPQRYQVYDMLQPHCKKVLIACNEQQIKTIDTGYEYIEDDESFGDIGPMNALLTAFTNYPQKNILLIGCDYPFLKTADLERFSLLCNDSPASFYNKEAAIYESMLAWYPATCFNELKSMFDTKQFSLQQLLRKYDAIKYIPADTNSIKSVNTIKAFTKAIDRLNAG